MKYRGVAQLGGRARPLPVADKGSAKEWQPSQNASKILFAKRDAVTATGISFVSLLSTQIQFHIEVWLSLVERYVRDSITVLGV